MSVAFDPKDRRIIYAGTLHLPWKTTDGGKTWQSIHVGMADDSDVFSIMVDRNRRHRILAGHAAGFTGVQTAAPAGGGRPARPLHPAESTPSCKTRCTKMDYSPARRAV
jgi:hypothetical protein